MTLLAARFDKKCGKSGIPDRAKCTKKTTARSSPKPELKERAFAISSAVQTARAGLSLYKGNVRAARRQIQSAGKNAAEYAQERGERTGNKKLLQFAATKNAVESIQAANRSSKALLAGNFRGFTSNLAESANTFLESASYSRQRKGIKLSTFEERNRQFGDLLQASKWAGAAFSSNNLGSASAGISRMRQRRQRSSLERSYDPRRAALERAFRKRSAKRDSLWAVGFKVDAGPSLSVGRGEKQSVEEGGGLTAKGRAKYNRQTGSNLKAPVTGKVKPGSKAAKRRKSFCARSRSWTGERGKAARRRWKC